MLLVPGGSPPGVGGGSVGGSGSRAGGESSRVRMHSAVTKTAASPTLHNLLVPATGMLLVSSYHYIFLPVYTRKSFSHSSRASVITSAAAAATYLGQFSFPFARDPSAQLRSSPVMHLSHECISDVDTTGAGQRRASYAVFTSFSFHCIRFLVVTRYASTYTVFLSGSQICSSLTWFHFILSSSSSSSFPYEYINIYIPSVFCGK